ncbi:MAG: hypothetical protein JO150_09295, partial [Acidobacteriaceae bacterium]|nr:hypothetical protein [Acidobacteriaceae bacterium]
MIVSTMGGAAVSWCAFADPPSKTLVDILSGELNREFSFLKAKADPAPYYMAYEVVEQQGQSLSATLGALLQNTRNHERGIDTTVRVGSPSFDNYHPYKSLPIRFTSFTALSLDNDANQIRRTLWSETDRVYRLASRR